MDGGLVLNPAGATADDDGQVERRTLDGDLIDTLRDIRIADDGPCTGRLEAMFQIRGSEQPWAGNGDRAELHQRQDRLVPCRHTRQDDQHPVANLKSFDARAELAASALGYLNRLSDLLFVLARVENRRAGLADVEWQGRGD